MITRKRGRVAEGTRLLSGHGPKQSIVSSNLTASAKDLFKKCS